MYVYRKRNITVYVSLWTAVHAVTKRTRRVCEGDYYTYTMKSKLRVIVRLKDFAKTQRIAYQNFKKSIGLVEKPVKV